MSKGLTRELKKVDDNNFLLVVNDHDNRHRSEKGYKREELREIYDSLKLQLDQIVIALRENNKKLAELKVDITPEEEKLLALMEKAAKKGEYDKIKQQVDEQVKDREMFKKQIEEIKLSIPEVTRKK